MGFPSLEVFKCRLKQTLGWDGLIQGCLCTEKVLDLNDLLRSLPTLFFYKPMKTDQLRVQTCLCSVPVFNMF